MSKLSYYEFFAGGGMARAGLGSGWKCEFANDFDHMKVATYEANWGKDHLVHRDVAKLTTLQLPGRADLAWASFPCQDLSLAGDYAGLGRAASAVITRSGTFWPFWELIKELVREGRAPRVIVLENVYGVLRSRGGKDFAAIGAAICAAGYRFGALVIDAVRFVPQSRPRVFFVAVDANATLSSEISADEPSIEWHPKALVEAYQGLSSIAKRKWLWWKLPVPSMRNTVLSDLIDDTPSGVRWHSRDETAHILGMMSPLNRTKVESAKRTRGRIVGGVYRRTREDVDGSKIQRAEVRFDGVAGCLRTPRGGSSRQTILIVKGNTIRSRLLSPREAARLMGLSDDYKLPDRYNDAYHVAGDGVSPPVVRYLAEYLLEPILRNQAAQPKNLAAE
jgi:DNA (cytosine-5)-methyltransferase 1